MAKAEKNQPTWRICCFRLSEKQNNQNEFQCASDLHDYLLIGRKFRFYINQNVVSTILYSYYTIMFTELYVPPAGLKYLVRHYVFCKKISEIQTKPIISRRLCQNHLHLYQESLIDCGTEAAI